MKTSVPFKLDFKIDASGILRIIDIGDGFGAGTAGFDDTPVQSTLVADVCAANNSALVTVLGELPAAAMQPETIHIPILQRQMPAEYALFDSTDLADSACASVLPYSYVTRIQSNVSFFWRQQLPRVSKTAIGLLGTEMHKLLWYTLVQKHMPAQHRDNILFWCNDNPKVALDLSAINMTNGVFIKIADRSDGGGDEVNYAKDEAEVRKTLTKLHQHYVKSHEPYKKHIYVIEPAYQTIKSLQNKQYNVTGRAFVTLTLDPETRELQLNIAGARWIFPTEALTAQKTQQQMLANAKNSKAILPLNAEDLSLLSQQILEVYKDILIAGIEQDDLITYCSDAPIIDTFKSVLRPNSSYRMMLDAKQLVGRDQLMYQASCLIDFLNGFVFRHYLQDSLLIVLPYLKLIKPDFCVPGANPKQSIMKIICRVSFLERYAQFIQSCPDYYKRDPRVAPVIAESASFSEKLDILIKLFLQVKDSSYERKDLNRTLRQAAAFSDIEVMKLLIGTNRAEVNACSPKTQQTALDFALKSNESSMKASCIQLLTLNGAKSMQSKVLPRPF